MTIGHVRVVGTGLLGASVGLALSRNGTHVSLHDISPTALALARDLGAGHVSTTDDDSPSVVVVAAPPDVAASVIAAELRAWPDAVVTDVASVKASILSQLRTLVSAEDLTRYVGSHPMAGRERSGAVAAQADLFEGRTWVVCPSEVSSPEAVDVVRRLAASTGAAVVIMDPVEHDAAVAAVSHVPQIAASLVAARLRETPEAAVALAGQGIRDVTRIAASDPMLWTQILAGNAAALLPVLEHLAGDLERVRAALQQVADDDASQGPAEGARGVLAQAIADGQLGHARIPGKHGAPPTTYGTLIVVIPDKTGSLGRLFHDVGEAGISIEDLRLEHAGGAPVGLAELSVLPAALERLREVLVAAGWSVHD